MESPLADAEYTQVRTPLGEVGFRSALGLLGTYSGQHSDLRGWLEDAPINRDLNLRLQYLAGVGLNLYRADIIFSNMVAGGVGFSEQLFVGSTGSLAELERIVRPRLVHRLHNFLTVILLTSHFVVRVDLPPTLRHRRSAPSSKSGQSS